ncbi:MAG: CPBP family intramembrane metalloprotease [Chlorobiaceae bacterium]|nr:CPBP family intramembrane metalloprotease [Chlorobiaceae bacterium]
MNSIDDLKKSGKPGLSGIIMVLLSMLVLYPVAGMLLTRMVSGDRSLEIGLTASTSPLLLRLLAVQAFGQVLLLGFPVLWLARRFSGGGLISRANLAWLGIGRRGGLRMAMVASAGMLLLQPLLYTLVELQNLVLPWMGEVGQSLLKEQARLDQLIRVLAGGRSVAASILAFLVLVLTPSICEELFFRGYLQKGLAMYLSSSKAVLATGILFALFHMEWFNMLPLTLLGWYIGYIYVKSDNLLVPAVAHATNNLTALVLLKSDTGFGRAGESAFYPLTLWQWWVLVLGTVFIFSLLIRYFSKLSAVDAPDNSMPVGRS